MHGSKNRTWQHNELVIVQRKQFGYHTDTFKLAHHIKNTHSVYVVCLDNQKPRFGDENIEVTYVSSGGNRLLRALHLVRDAIGVMRRKPEAHIFVVYFPLCSLITIGSRKNVTLDFRTGSVSPKWYVRSVSDSIAILESRFFRRFTVISPGLRKHLRLNNARTYVLPVGADVISTTKKSFTEPRLFYIGTFNNRNIEETLQGIYVFLGRNPGYACILSYDIVGYGYKKEDHMLRKQIKKLGLEDTVTFHGQLNHERAQSLFDKCNIGVSYIPLTSYYDHQPPTKTYEYILSGMSVIATATTENKKIVNSTNGVICSDNVESFSRALETCVSKFRNYDSRLIRETLADYRWPSIVDNFREQVLHGE